MGLVDKARKEEFRKPEFRCDRYDRSDKKTQGERT